MSCEEFFALPDNYKEVIECWAHDGKCERKASYIKKSGGFYCEECKKLYEEGKS